MTKQYQEQLRSRLDEIGIDLDVEIEIKPFFGGAAAYANGHICMSLTKVGFALKLPEYDRYSLFQVEGTRPLRYFPNAPIKKEYVLLPDEMVEELDRLRQWVTKSINYVTSISAS